MKNICIKIVLSALLFSKGNLFAQDIYFSAGFNAANITAYGSSSFQKPGAYFSIGKSNLIEGSKDARINFGIAFSQKGARKVPDPKNLDFVEYNVRLNYVEVPVSIWVKMKNLKGILGLSGGYLIHSYERSLNGSPVFNSGFKKLDFSVALGGGVMIGEKVLLNLTGTYSLLPIREIGGTGTVGFARGPRNTLVNIGITYLLKKKEPTDDSSSIEE